MRIALDAAGARTHPQAATAWTAALVAFLMTTSGALASRENGDGYVDVYEAMEKTDPAAVGTVAPGSAEEAAAIERFTDFVSVMSPENAREKTLSVYAESAYLNDTLVQITGAEAIRDYFVKSLGGAESVTVEVTEVAVSKGNYYLRWIMDIQFKKLKKGEVTRSAGMSHIRFDREGKVTFHHDYWDSTSGFFQHVPVVGWLIGKVKARVH